ncbi:hypothetical protein LXL04_008014 [Taraxacum kok-saghyz]
MDSAPGRADSGRSNRGDQDEIGWRVAVVAAPSWQLLLLRNHGQNTVDGVGIVGTRKEDVVVDNAGQKQEKEREEVDPVARKKKRRKGIPVMLLRNIDQKNGLCNGTRLQVIVATHRHNYVTTNTVVMS